MSVVMLNWRSLTSEYASRSKFLVKGTELSVALFGPHSRFAVYEVRTVTRNGNEFEYDREYVVRDASLISDADVKAGKRPPIVGRTTDYDRLLVFVQKHQTRSGD